MAYQISSHLIGVGELLSMIHAGLNGEVLCKHCLAQAIVDALAAVLLGSDAM